jgi:hypothetical protein
MNLKNAVARFFRRKRHERHDTAAVESIRRDSEKVAENEKAQARITISHRAAVKALNDAVDAGKVLHDNIKSKLPTRKYLRLDLDQDDTSRMVDLG